MLYESIPVSLSAYFQWLESNSFKYFKSDDFFFQMLPSGLSLLDSTDDILYVRDALLPGKSDLEATYIFTK